MTGFRTQLKLIQASFENVMRRVPGLTVGRLADRSQPSSILQRLNIDRAEQIPGFEATVTTPSGEPWTIIVLTRASGEPRLIRESCARLLSAIKNHPNRARIYPVVAAHYIGRRSALICHEMNVGYLDLSGNFRLAFDSIFVEREVPENKNVEKRPLRSIFSSKSSRVVRLLLENPYRGWQVQDLARAGEISLGLASKVKQKLLDLDLASASPGGLKLKDAKNALIEWSRSYSYKQNEIFSCYAPGEPQDLENQLADYCQSKKLEYGLTLFSGSNRIAPFVRGITLSTAYIDGDIKKTAHDLGWKPVPSGANFVILRPSDEFILRGLQSSPTKWQGKVVSDIQLYLDLASYKTRGEEAAEFLLERRIEPLWVAASESEIA